MKYSFIYPLTHSYKNIHKVLQSFPLNFEMKNLRPRHERLQRNEIKKKTFILFTTDKERLSGEQNSSFHMALIVIWYCKPLITVLFQMKSPNWKNETSKKRKYANGYNLRANIRRNLQRMEEHKLWNYKQINLIIYVDRFQ